MNKDVTILVAEDDDGHAELIVEQLRDAGLANPVIRFQNGKELLDHLEGNSAAGSTGLGPCLVLLDIRMPVMDGVEALKAIKSRPALRTIPVIMLTTTDDPREVEECYREGCNLYITKPLDFAKFSETLKRVGLFVLVLSVAQPGRTTGAEGA